MRNYELEYEMAQKLSLKDFLIWITPVTIDRTIVLPKSKKEIFRRVKAAFVKDFNMQLGEILAENRRMGVKEYRHAFCYTLYINGLSKEEIAPEIDRSRYSVRNSINAISGYIKTKDPIMEELTPFIKRNYRTNIP